MSDYTPTTEEIIEEWTDGSVDVPESRKQFFRWLAEHDRQTWDEGAKAMMHAIGANGDTLSFIAPHNPYRKDA